MSTRIHKVWGFQKTTVKRVFHCFISMHPFSSLRSTLRFSNRVATSTCMAAGISWKTVHLGWFQGSYCWCSSVHQLKYMKPHGKKGFHSPCQLVRFCRIYLLVYSETGVSSNRISEWLHPWNLTNEPRKKTSYFPLYWLVNRDPYNSLL